MQPGIDPTDSRDQAQVLLDAAKNGSTAALGELLQTFRTYLLSIGDRELRGPIRSRVAPSDMVQEAFAEGQRSIATFRGETTEQFGIWLRGILLHRVANARRYHIAAERRSLRREVPPPVSSSNADEPGLALDEETPSRVVSRAEEARQVRAAIARLPAQYQQVIELRNFQLLPFEEIGRIMSRPSEAARALWGRAVRRLKEELDARA